MGFLLEVFVKPDMAFSKVAGILKYHWSYAARPSLSIMELRQLQPKSLYNTRHSLSMPFTV